MSDLYISQKKELLKRLGEFAGKAFLFTAASISATTVLFIFYFIAKDAIPFFQMRGFSEFFTSTKWYPSGEPATFGAFAIFYGTCVVTLGAIVFAMPLGVAASICLSDILPFNLRQVIKPVIEILAAIPSVAFGFFALVVFAPLLQNHGGLALSVASWLIGLSIGTITIVVLSDLIGCEIPLKNKRMVRWTLAWFMECALVFALYHLGEILLNVRISSGTNALNVSIILGIMALPTIVSVSEDALQSVGRELREGSYALGATRAETILKVVVPASISGILSAVILGVMRAVGETMVVWMASGNAAKVPKPFYNILEPVRTLTATIAGDMGEADQVTGSERFHVLFAMALSLLVFSFIMNLATEIVAKRCKSKLKR